tara:strand:+ start:1650 stop:2027 length:378 start_codon:yes stop_codon:yes gene_type:complete
MIDLIIIGLLIIYILLVTYYFAAEIFLVTLLFFILAYVAYTVWTTKFRKKKVKQVQELLKEIPKKEEPVKEPNIDQERIELKDYVKYNIHYGQTPSKVRKALEREGWPKKKIDQAFLDYYDKANK